MPKIKKENAKLPNVRWARSFGCAVWVGDAIAGWEDNPTMAGLRADDINKELKRLLTKRDERKERKQCSRPKK